LIRAAAALWLLASAARADSPCGTVPALSAPPAAVARTGLYRNVVYGYALRLPASLTAWVIPGSAERGFSVMLAGAPPAYLRVDASYDTFYDVTPVAVHRRDLDTRRLHVAALADEPPAKTALGGAAGWRFVTHVRCGAGNDYIDDDTIVIRRREIYRVQLHSADGRYAEDLKLLRGLTHSWRWLPVSTPP
jgi:hypothetical protein